MTVLHSGTTKKYSEHWESIFGEGTAKKKVTARKKKAAPKKTAKKRAKKKT